VEKRFPKLLTAQPHIGSLPKIFTSNCPIDTPLELKKFNNQIPIYQFYFPSLRVTYDGKLSN
jgi:hypothetical protein